MRIVARPRPILFWLRWLVIIAVVPGWVATAASVAAVYHNERNTISANTVGLSHSVMRTVDLDLKGAIAALRVLAMSGEIDSGNMAAFHRQAREVLATQVGNGIALVDANGRQIMSTIRAQGEVPPRTAAPALLNAVFKTGRPAVSDLYIGATSRKAQVAVGVPVIRGNRVAYALMMGLMPERLNDVLRSEDLPAGWAAAVFDRSGTMLARSGAGERVFGRKGSPALLRQLAGAPEGVIDDATANSLPVLAGFSRSRLSGWTTVVAVPDAGLIVSLHKSWWLSAAGAGAVVFIVSLLAWYMSVRIGRSIRALSAPAIALASDAPVLVSPIEITEVDEVGRALTRARDLIHERTIARDRAREEADRHRAELARFARISLAGEMAAGMAHELSQPLTAIVFYGRGCLRLLKNSNPDPATLAERMRAVVQQAERASDILVRLRDFVRHGAARRHLVAVQPMIDTVVSFAKLETAQSGVEITVHSDPDLPLVFADEIQIEQVLLNLLHNANDAMAEAGTERREITVEARRKDAQSVEISIADTGPGVPEGLKEKIFEPFLTTKAGGMGMGLAISRTLVDAHGGTLNLARNSGAGATFVVELPTTPAEASSDAG